MNLRKSLGSWTSLFVPAFWAFGLALTSDFPTVAELLLLAGNLLLAWRVCVGLEEKNRTLAIAGLAVGVLLVTGFQVWWIEGKRNATSQRPNPAINVSSPATLVPSQAPDHKGLQIAGPRLEIGLILGADKGIGVDSVVDCGKPIYTCLTADEVRQTPLVLDVGQKGWGRLIFQFKNNSGTKLLNPVTHVESSNPISLEFAPRPDPTRLPRNVLDISGGAAIYPYSLAKASYDFPIDVVVPAGINSISLHLKVFGDNMKAEEQMFQFAIKR